MSPLSSFITLMAGGLAKWLGYAFALGYLLGSIPFGLLLTRAAGLGDVRKIGSGNIGATNVLRTGNKKLAAATLLLDGLKGTAAVLIADHYFGLAPAMLAGLGAFLGHLYPVWLKFRGGKGVATYIGVILGLVWQGGAVFALVWIAVAYLSRYSSLAALVASVATPTALLLMGHAEMAALAALMTVLLLWKHRANIGRLIKGEEPEIGAKG
ncbi:MAG: glycerol-3-phosphate 1-O-acyltransferase PlsY [Hyphomicrobium sp.]|nr:glycerol-3-phosphate 1-O-acyltransferase PlsY [Hyphomicrobium sp.]